MLFKYLHVSDVDTKYRLLPRARHFEVRLAAIQLWYDVIESLVVNPIFMLARLIQIGFILIIALWFHSNPSWNWLSYIFLYEVAAFATYYLVLVLPTLVLSSYSLAQWCWLVIVLVTCATGLYQTVATAGNNFDNVLPTLSFFVMLSLSSIIIATIINGILLALSRIIRNARYPGAVVVDGLLEILYLVETKSGQWTDFNFKRLLVNKIEEVAYCVQNNFPRLLRSGDEATNVWLRNNTHEIAAGFRELKKSVLLSKPSARTQFVADISASVINATLGNWLEIKKAPSEEFPLPQSWRIRIAEFFRAFLVGAGPFLLVWIVQKLPFNLPTELLNPLIIPTVLWAILTLITKADPLYKDKIGALKDLTPLLPMTGKNKN